MTGTERMKLVKKEKLCFNCLKENPMLTNVAQRINAFIQVVKNIIKKKVDDTDKENTKVCMSKTAKHQAAFLQIVPVNVKSKGGRFISTYALLDSGSESTLV